MARSRIRLKRDQQQWLRRVDRHSFQSLIVTLSIIVLINSAGKGLCAAESSVQSLVQQLNSQSFPERVSAQRQLEKIAPKHLKHIEEHALNGNAETAERLVEVLESIFLKNDNNLGEQAEQSLERLSRTGGTASVSAGLVLQGNSYLRESRARAALEKLGGQFVYYRPDAHYQGRALFSNQVATLPEFGVGFGPSAVLHSIYLHENWSGTKDDLWHLTRLGHHQDLAIYSIKGNSIDINDLFLLSRSISGLSIQERGACLGIRSQTFGSGCRVGTVVKGAAADKGGLQTGDLVLKLNDINIGSFQNLVQTLQDFNIGDEVTFTIIREGLQMEKVVTLGSWRDVARRESDPMVVDPPPHFQGPFGKPVEPENKESTNNKPEKNDSTAKATESSDED